jgi:hypothetical protein
MGVGEYLSVAAQGTLMAAARPDGVGSVRMRVRRGGRWDSHDADAHSSGGIFAGRDVVAGAREGVYFTRDLGTTWLWIERLPFRRCGRPVL